jgi:hypothetical protein
MEGLEFSPLALKDVTEKAFFPSEGFLLLPCSIDDQIEGLTDWGLKSIAIRISRLAGVETLESHAF